MNLMPFKDPQKKKEWQREYISKKRLQKKLEKQARKVYVEQQKAKKTLEEQAKKRDTASVIGAINKNKPFTNPVKNESLLCASVQYKLVKGLKLITEEKLHLQSGTCDSCCLIYKEFGSLGNLGLESFWNLKRDRKKRETYRESQRKIFQTTLSLSLKEKMRV